MNTCGLCQFDVSAVNDSYYVGEPGLIKESPGDVSRFLRIRPGNILQKEILSFVLTES